MNAARSLVFWHLALLPALLGPAGGAHAQRAEVAGVAVEMTATQLDGGPQSQVTFRVSDMRSGQPLAGLHPLAWIISSTRAEALDGAGCRDQVKGLVEGRLAKRADADLNRFLLLVLNGDASISFIDPQVSFGNTRLQSLITLPSPGADWVLSRDGGTLYVSMPEADAVAVIDTATHKLRASVPTGPASRPTRLALAPGTGQVWVDLAGAAAVATIGADATAARVSASPGAHRFAFTPDGGTAFVSGTGSSRIVALDTAGRTGPNDFNAEGVPAAIDYGRASNLLYLALRDGGVVAIDPSQRRITATIATAPGIAALRFEPEGRFALLANALDGTVSVLDTANQHLSAPVLATEGADEIAFSRNYAYVRGRGAAQFALFELQQIRQGRLEPVVIRAGDGPAAGTQGGPALAELTVPAPDGAGAMLAGAGGRTIYVYNEGMMAPAGTLDAYGHRIAGLLVLDRSLRETAPGTYATTVRIAKSGAFDIPFLIDRPRLVHCFRADLAGSGPSGGTERTGLRVEQLLPDATIIPGTLARLAFRIFDPATGEAVQGLRDVQAVAIEPPGTWQQRRRAHETADGVYAATWVFPRAGRYDVALSVPSRGIGYAGWHSMAVTVLPEALPPGGQP